MLRTSQVALVIKNPPANAGDTKDAGWIRGLGRSPGVAGGNSLHGQRNLVGYGPWSLK